jgi:RNA polymerase sigma-70 factor, ECF subfamily
MDSGDERVIERARHGDRDAFQSLVECHSAAVFRLAYRMTGNTIDAEDVVQEAFLRAWKQMGRFDGRASFGTWVHRICANCAIDRLRARKTKTEKGKDAATDPFANIPHRGPSPERLAQSGEITRLLIPALDELTEMERAAFVMRHYECLPIKEISRVLGVESGAAKHSVFRAVQKLRRALQPAMSKSR